MLTQHIALVPEADGVSASDLARVGAALQKQVTRDLSPVWKISATVDAFPRLEDVPVGYWPIVISLCELGRESGIHLDENGQPYAQVQATAGSFHWSIAASRACLEMLVNPYGDRTVTAPSVRPDEGIVELVLDIGGPCAGPAHIYAINDVLVSDFCLPAFFGFDAGSSGTRYSFCGRLSTPFELLPGGHLTWLDPASNNWWLRSFWGDAPSDTKLGVIDRRMVSVRELVRAQRPLNAVGLGYDALEEQARASRRNAIGASQARAHRLRALLGARLDSQALMEFDASDERPESDDRDELLPLPEFESSLSIVLEPETPSFSIRRPPPTPARAGRDEDDDDSLEQGIDTLHYARPDPSAVVNTQVTESAQRTPAPDRMAAHARTPYGSSDKTPSARSAYASFAPLDVAAFGEPPGAGRRMGLIFSAIAGALLVLLAWGGRTPIVKSAASATPARSTQASAKKTAPATVYAVKPPALLAPASNPVPFAASPLVVTASSSPSVKAAEPVPVVTQLATQPVTKTENAPAKTENALTEAASAARERRRARRAAALAGGGGAGTVQNKSSSLYELVNTRR